MVPDRRALVILDLALLYLWCLFIGSSLIPSYLHVTGPPLGLHSFTHKVQDAEQLTDGANITISTRWSASRLAMPRACQTGRAAGSTRSWNSCVPCRPSPGSRW